CNRKRMVARNRETGEFCCNNCYVKLFQPRWSCAGCGSVRQARYVIDPAAGTRYCAKCYASEILTATCSECGAADARVHLRSEDGKAICAGCYHLHHARERRADRTEPTEHQRAALLEMLRIARERGGWCLSTAYEDS